MSETTAKQAPPGYRCPGCRAMHSTAPCFPGCGDDKKEATSNGA